MVYLLCHARNSPSSRPGTEKATPKGDHSSGAAAELDPLVRRSGTAMGADHPRAWDGFDVVTVGIEDERTVIVRVIVRPNARRAIVTAAGGERPPMERADPLPAVTSKSDMHRRLVARRLTDPEGRIALQIHAAELGPAFRFHQKFDAQRSKGNGIEGLATCVVGDLNTDVIEKQLRLARPPATVFLDSVDGPAPRMITVPVSCVRSGTVFF